MGKNLFATLRRLKPRRKQRAIMVGLCDSGKTSILERLGNKGRVKTLLAIGINLETVTFKRIKFMVWDSCGQQIILRFFRRLVDEADVLIFVVDSSDRGQLERARESLHQLLRADSRNTPLLIYANKQDLPRAVPTSELVARLLSNAEVEQDESVDEHTNGGNDWHSYQRGGQQNAIQPSSMRGLNDRSWHIQPCSAIDGRGLRDGLIWLKTLEPKQ